MSGIKSSCNRPKTAANLRSKSEKKFRNDSPEGRAAYAKKMADRAARRKKRGKKSRK